MIEQHLDTYRVFFCHTVSLKLMKNGLIGVGMTDETAHKAIDDLMVEFAVKGEEGVKTFKKKP